MAYKPIENYGIIGNMHSSALVGIDGSIDWLCFPRVDSPSLFGAILDENKGGHFKISSDLPGIKCKQFYWPETNVLITRFLTDSGVGELVDYMPVACPSGAKGFHGLIRRVHVTRGSMPFRMECFPAFNYARDAHETTPHGNGARFASAELTVDLATSVQLEKNLRGTTAQFVLNAGESAIFCLKDRSRDEAVLEALTADEEEDLFRRTISFWRNWLGQCRYNGRWREIVHRSALVLKLLTFEPTGAIVAAPTTSLPEEIGGVRNWDYRYTWIRDASFTLYALLRIGFTEEAARFMEWIDARCHELDAKNPLKIMYGVDGRHDLKEEVLSHLEGYRGSGPVRIGNGAHNQLQLDIYGELLDSVYLFNKYGSPISYDLWTHLRRMTNWLCDNWQKCDDGIWEVRGGQRHFVYSKVMSWVAVDRAVRLADKRGFPADRTAWLKTRDTIYEEVMAKGWSKTREAFVQSYGSDALDASNLMMPLVFFISPTDPKMLKTLAAINRSPDEGGLVADNLVYRYDTRQQVDGIAGDEGTFNICTFWLVEALTRAGQVNRAYLEEARLIFEKMLGYANHVGLYGEEIGPNGEALGNFPQAFTHLGLISAAFNLDRALGAGK